MFDTGEFIIAICLYVDAHLKLLLTLYPPRRRGFTSGLSDSEVLTLEIVGDFWPYGEVHGSEPQAV